MMGVRVGVLDGERVGNAVGLLDGVSVGLVGYAEGVEVGSDEGAWEGPRLGARLGMVLGRMVGLRVGVPLGPAVGVEDGKEVGDDDGTAGEGMHQHRKNRQEYPHSMDQPLGRVTYMWARRMGRVSGTCQRQHRPECHPHHRRPSVLCLITSTYLLGS